MNSKSATNSVVSGIINRGPSGYISGTIATDNESARLSNVHPYKYNTITRENLNAINNIRKISPNGPVGAPLPLSRNGARAILPGRGSNTTSNKGSIISMPGSIVNEYAEGSVLSGASAVTATNTKILPDISRENSKNQKRIISNRKASPEAIALLMAGVPSKTTK